jgi:acrylyl-CoA reductase (NADPH)
LGASSIVDRSELSEKGRPVGKERWAGAVDAVGSHTLANVLAQTQYGGAVAACGLAQGGDLPTSVYPFILRGVSLLGVDSVMAPKPTREAAWQRLAQDLDISKLEAMIVDMPLADASAAAAEILKGQIRGRVVVDVNA